MEWLTFGGDTVPSDGRVLHDVTHDGAAVGIAQHLRRERAQMGKRDLREERAAQSLHDS